MFMRSVAAQVFTASLSLSSSSQAQSDMAFTPSCWFGNMSFSPGATVRAGESVMVCVDGTTWEATEKDASGCLFDGKFFSIGSVYAFSAQAPQLQCLADGQWEATPLK